MDKTVKMWHSVITLKDVTEAIGFALKGGAPEDSRIEISNFTDKEKNYVLVLWED